MKYTKEQLPGIILVENGSGTKIKLEVTKDCNYYKASSTSWGKSYEYSAETIVQNLNKKHWNLISILYATSKEKTYEIY